MLRVGLIRFLAAEQYSRPAGTGLLDLIILHTGHYALAHGLSHPNGCHCRDPNFKNGRGRGCGYHRLDAASCYRLLSFQSAGQIVASRALGFNEIPTVVITSLLCDLVSDAELLAWRNGKRDRRIVAFCLTLLGAISGGWITRATGDIAPVLLLAAGIKLVLVVLWVIWRGESIL